MMTKKQIIATTVRESNCPPNYRKVMARTGNTTSRSHHDGL